MSLDEATRDKINHLVQNNSVMLFMKGNRQAPQCGFSAKVVSILDEYLSDYETLDVLSNGDIREGI
ncbi:MAG TPA: monothiol glutaredoxin, Grx4 family, partial [Myxococcales bacterium]|nr:monothiol glutaredoxin, Grx4 family [Myxococcales bacterium]